MTIEKINFSYPNDTLQSVFDTETKTALELSAHTSKKVDECIELVNGVEQIAINASAIVDEMRITQDQFVTENNDIRSTIIADNQEFIDGLTASQTAFETGMTATLEQFEDDTTTARTLYETGLNTSQLAFNNSMTTALNEFEVDTTTAKTTYETGLNNSKTAFETSMTTAINDANALVDGMENNINTVLIPSLVGTRIDNMLTDGSLLEAVDDQLYTPLLAQLTPLIPEPTARLLYVNVNSGSNITGTGTIALPFKTITHALSTLKKSFAGYDHKIRVYAGDYTAEGTIMAQNFIGGLLTITAFDNANDVAVVSSNYKIDNMAIKNCDNFVLSGIESVPSNAGYAYGFYAQNSKAHFAGCSFNKLGNINSGWGCTEHSFIKIENCKCTGALNVISANYGARVVTYGWVAGSITNSYVYKMDNGAVVVQGDTTEPSYVALRSLVALGGTILNETGIPTSYASSHQSAIAKNVALVESLVIPIALQNAPSWLVIDACIAGTKINSKGKWTKQGGNVQFCISTDFNGTSNATYTAINLEISAGVSVSFNVTTVTKTEITLTRTAIGAPTGTVNVSCLAGV